MDYILVILGGSAGSVTRYALGKYISGCSKSRFPIGTFLINITGALLLGIVFTTQKNNSMYMLFGNGFLGAYTTFSTFMYEGFQLFQDNEKLSGFCYILGSLLIGITGFFIGTRIGGAC